MGNKTSTIFYHEWRDIFRELSLEEIGAMTLAILDYDSDGTLPDFKDRTMKALFRQFKISVDNNQKKWEDRCEKNRKNINKRWGKDTNEYDRIQSNTNEYESIRTDTKRYETIPKIPIYDYDYDNDTDNDIYTDSNTKVYTGEQSSSEKKEERKTYFVRDFTVPSQEDVMKYFQDKSKYMDPPVPMETEARKFFEYYDKNDWKIKGSQIKYWMSVADRWISNIRDKPKKSKYINYDQRDTDYDSIVEQLLINQG